MVRELIGSSRESARLFFYARPSSRPCRRGLTVAFLCNIIV
jgi:hypothetical protein